MSNSRNTVAFAMSVKAADVALRIPFLRNILLNKLFQKLDRSHGYNESDDAKLMHTRWLGRHLKAFLQRLIHERPAAARAILRFLGTWSRDIYRRTDAQHAGDISPCTVVIEPTERCNLRCPGCYANSTHDGGDLPFERFVQIIDQVIDMGVTLITLSGGEPFLREKKDRAISRAARRYPGRGFLVYTNGTMIDETIANALGRVGNVFPAVSVEGFEHQTDARRGKGIYEQNRNVRRMLADRGVMTGFSATVTRENCESICNDDFIDLRIEEGDLFGWFFLIQPIGRAPRPDLMVTADQRAMLRETIYRWRQEDRPIFLGDFWNDGHLTGGCIAGGKYYFHIYGNGDISPCVFSPIACGNIFDIVEGRSPYRSLHEFALNHPIFKAFREEQKQVTDRNRPCLLIDHPDAFRRICRSGEYRPSKNMPPDYLEGDTAHIVDGIAQEWATAVPDLPPLPAEKEQMEMAEGNASELMNA